MSTTPHHVELFAGTVRLAYTDSGAGSHSYLLLHGGAGPFSFRGLAASLVAKGGRVLIPTHPGFAGEPRPEFFNRIDHLVLVYLSLIDHLHLSNVTVIGNSMGGWIAAEMGLRNSPLISRVILLNAVGISIEGTGLKILDPTSLSPSERSAAAFFNPTKFAIAPQGPEGLAVMAANQQALRVYAGEAMQDPTFNVRLSGMKVPVMVVWGLSDRIVTEEFGRMYVRLIPNARFEGIPEAGHFPQIEKVDEVVALIKDFEKPTAT